jgi:thiol:disulfide interchange protein
MPDAAGARVLREDDYEERPVRHLTAVPEQRRTVRITGQAAPPRRRRSATANQIQSRPDRIVLWAFLLGLFLVFMAVATANASPLH